MASAAGSAVPLPGVGVAIDLTILVEEILEYVKGFGLTKDAIESLEKLYGTEVGFIEKGLSDHLRTNYPVIHHIRQNSPKALVSRKSIQIAAARIIAASGFFILKQLTLSAASEVVETGLKFIPLIGLGISAGVSYFVTRFQLNSFLRNVKQVAHFANNYLIETKNDRLVNFEL